MTSSSFFPSAKGVAAKTLNSVPSPAVTQRQSVAAADSRGIRVVSQSSLGAEAAGQELKFPATRSALWDRTPQDAPTVLSATGLRFSLPANLVAPIAMTATHGELALKALDARVHLTKAETGQSSRSRAQQVHVRAHALSSALVAPDETAGAPSGMGVEASRVLVHWHDWRTGSELTPSREECGALLVRSRAAQMGAGPLLFGEIIPMCVYPTCSPDRNQCTCGCIRHSSLCACM